MPSKTLVIGLDGAEPELLLKWADQGLLPNFKSVLKDWFQCPIDIAQGFGDGVFWTSLITGVGPATHGRYFPYQYNSASYDLDAFSLDADLGREPFWYFCSKAGASVGVVDLYTAPLRTGLNGIQIADWMTHHPNDSPRSWPVSLVEKFSQKYMRDPFAGKCEVENRNDEHAFIEMHAEIIKRTKAKSQACCDLLSQNEWDLFCVGFCDAHDISHQSWHWHDAESPIHPAEWVGKYGNPILQTYQALDNCVGDLLESARADAIYIVSGLGMCRQTPFNTVIQQVLGHYCGRSGSRKELTDGRREMPYFEVPHNMSAAAIRVNLKGRDSHGIVDENEYAEVCKELEQKLLKLSDADTGESIVDRVVQVQQEHTGKHLQKLPDLFAVWKKEMDSQRVRVDQSAVFELEQVFGPENRSGDHSTNALFLTNLAYQANSIRTEAVAPTICRSLGINLPHTDAAPITET